jgi:hypothetical protein
MTVYRARVSDEPSHPSIPRPQPRGRPEEIPSLAIQLGLEEMEFDEERSRQGESVDKEFSRYSNSPLSLVNVDILNFWAVGTISSRDFDAHLNDRRTRRNSPRFIELRWTTYPSRQLPFRVREFFHPVQSQLRRRGTGCIRHSSKPSKFLSLDTKRSD